MRQKDLAQNQATYSLVPAEPIHQYVTLNMTQQQLLGVIKTDPFIRDFGMGYLGLGKGGEEIFKAYMKLYGSQPMTGFKDYAATQIFFKTAVKKAFGVRHGGCLYGRPWTAQLRNSNVGVHSVLRERLACWSYDRGAWPEDYKLLRNIKY